MKTIKKARKVERASNEAAEEKVTKGWKYCPKSEWKERVRDKPEEKVKRKKK
jgi:hypothetical protein